MIEKDDTELRLEKVLFGDHTGFLESLNHRARTQNTALVLDGDRHSIGESEDLEEDEDISQLADEQVCYNCFFRDLRLTPGSFSFSMPAQALCRQPSQTISSETTVEMTHSRGGSPGMIVMMIVSQYL